MLVFCTNSNWSPSIVPSADTESLYPGAVPTSIFPDVELVAEIEVIVLNIFKPDTVWPFSAPITFSEIELPSRSVPFTVKLLLLSSSTDLKVTLVPRNVVEALSPFNEKLLPALTVWDFARAS